MQSRLSIFIIDDDRIACLIAKMTIEKYFPIYKILACNSAQSALEALPFKIKYDLQNLPAVILLDLEMPLYDGWGFLEILQTMHTNASLPRPQVCILTNSLHEKDIIRSRAYPYVKAFLPSLSAGKC